MFEYLLLEDFGIFARLEWQKHQKINIIIGENDTGKTYILKVLYCIAKSVEDYTKRSYSDNKNWKEILSEKMFSVYQPSKLKLGEIVRKSGNRLNVEAKMQGDKYSFSFGKDTKDTITKCSEAEKIDLSALYIPTKEVLTAFEAITTINEQLQIFGFDQTYQDLIQALRVPTSLKKLDKPLEEVLGKLQTLFQGEISVEKKDLFLSEDAKHMTCLRSQRVLKKLVY